MTILQSFQLAIKSILSNRMRSVLTMLGMIIGVGSVIIIMGMMNDRGLDVSHIMINHANLE